MYLLLRSLFLILFVTQFPPAASAQVPPEEELPPDPVVLVDSVRTLREINRGPKRALLWSILPGGGQVYNKSWWKVPLVYGGLLGVIAVADYNQTQYSRFVTALEDRCLGAGNVVIIPNAECIPNEDSEFPVSVATTQALITARNNANRSRQTAYFGILGVYLLQAIEAFTDAHLRDFDISDDLSLRIAPVAQPGAAGIGLVVPLGSGRARQRELARAAAALRSR